MQRRERKAPSRRSFHKGPPCLGLARAQGVLDLMPSREGTRPWVRPERFAERRKPGNASETDVVFFVHLWDCNASGESYITILF